MIITISRQLGSEGDRIAARVAIELGLQLVDRVAVGKAAETAGMPAALLQRLMYEGQRHMASEIMESFGAARVPDRVSAPSASPLLNVFAPMLPPATMSLEEAAKVVGRIIQQIASQDNVLVLGQGGQMLLREVSHACHVQIVAPFDIRAARVVERDKVTLNTARRRIRVSDDARATYLARYYDVRWQDPLLYHLVINTGFTPVEDAVSLIVHAARACTKLTR